MRSTISTRLIVAAVALCVVAAFAAAPASARVTAPRQYGLYPDRSAPARESEAFDWGDAAIGAGVGTTLLIAASGAAIVLARRRRQAGPRLTIGAQEGL
jgi:hypothetical protein